MVRFFFAPDHEIILGHAFWHVSHATKRILMHVFSTSVFTSVVSELPVEILEGYAFEPEYAPEELEALEREQNDSSRGQESQTED